MITQIKPISTWQSGGSVELTHLSVIIVFDDCDSNMSTAYELGKMETLPIPGSEETTEKFIGVVNGNVSISVEDYANLSDKDINQGILDYVVNKIGIELL